MINKTDTNEGTLVTYLGDVQALVTDGLKALERQTENLRKVSHKDALPAVVHGHRLLKRQEAAIRARLESCGGSATAPVKEAVAAFAGAAAGLLNAVRPSETVKSLRDDAVFFSGLGIAYLLLYTTATGIADADTAALAQEGYEDAARMVMHLDSILPKVTIEELSESHEGVADTTERVKAMVVKAWDRAQPLGA